MSKGVKNPKPVKEETSKSAADIVIPEPIIIPLKQSQFDKIKDCMRNCTKNIANLIYYLKTEDYATAKIFLTTLIII